MTETRLPDGFAVRIDRRVRVLGHGSTLLGGSPARLLRLAPAAQEMLSDGRLEVHDELSAKLARTLLDATVAHPRPSGGPSYRDVTVVIPVRDNGSGLTRLIGSLRGMRVIVVDDGSATAVSQDDLTETHCCTVDVLRHSRSRGPAAARNTGLAACTTEFVAFLDSDVLPRRGWLEALLGHFSDPAVALVAPRIVAMSHGDHVIGRYEAVRSSLDLGRREAPVVPYGRVAYVPSAAMVCRTSALRELGGFDETMWCGEDVDLCWRLVDAGARLRYEPVARVAHEHRVGLWNWWARKEFYGESAAPLAVRHPDKTAPLMISAGMLAAWLLATVGSVRSFLVSLVLAGLIGRRVARSMSGVDTGPWDVASVTARGLGAAGLQLSSAACRHYWPVTLVLALLSQHFRRALLVAAVIDGAVDWLRHTGREDSDAEPVNPMAYLLLKRADDLAYGAGLWVGVWREHSVAPLKPQIRA